MMKGLREASQNKHRASAGAICQAHSDETVAQSISKYAPRQWERSDKATLTRRLREASVIGHAAIASHWPGASLAGPHETNHKDKSHLHMT